MKSMSDDALNPKKSLHQRAVRYLEMGLSVIPLKPRDKKPSLSHWAQYQKRRPENVELDSWFIGTDNNIGVVCGQVSGNLAVVDFDDEKAFHYCFPHGGELTDETLCVRTGKGVHVYVRLERTIKKTTLRSRSGTGKVEPGLPVDIQGEGGYVVAPPSVHPSGKTYEFIGKAENILLLDERSWANSLQQLADRAEEWPIVEKLLPMWTEDSHIRQNLAMGVSGLFRKLLRFNEDRVRRVLEGICKATDDAEVNQRVSAVQATFSKDIDDIAILNWLGGGLFETLKKSVPAKLCYGGDGKRKHTKSNEENGGTKEPKKVASTGKTFSDGNILEVCYDGHGTYFWLKPGDPNPYIGKINEFQDDYTNETLVPTMDDFVQKGVILLPSEPKDYESELDLFQRINEFIRKWGQIDPIEEKLLAGYVLLSWVYQKCPALPIMNYRADVGKGKSRMLEIAHHICYRGTRMSGCLSFSSLFRIADKWKGTVCINEGDFKQSLETDQIVKYLNERFEKHGVVTRTNKDTMKEECYSAFGPTVITSRQTFSDNALESRCLTTKMKERTRKDIPVNLPDEFDIEAKELRNELLMFRFRNFPRFENDYWLEFNGITSRLNQILQPLASLAKMISPDFYSLIESIAEDLQEQIIEASSESPDGLIVRSYLELERNGNDAITPTDISEKITQIGGELSAKAIGRRRSALGFGLDRSEDKRIYTLTDDRRKSLIQNYIPKDERDGFQSQTHLDDDNDMYDDNRGQGVLVEIRDYIKSRIANGPITKEELIETGQKKYPDIRKMAYIFLERGQLISKPNGELFWK